MAHLEPFDSKRISRRNVFELLVAASTAAAFSGCATPGSAGFGDVDPGQPVPIDSTPIGKIVSYEDSVDALFDVLLPADRDAAGTVTSPGAREASAGLLFGDDELVSLATGLGWIAPLNDTATTMVKQGATALRAAVNALLDLRATRVRPLVAFKDLPRADQVGVVDDALTEPTLGPLVGVARAAALVAYLGAVYSDVGLQAVGFPPYEDFAGGLAVSGYPRTPSGRLIDVASEDLAALAAAGQLDDYTYNRMPSVDPSLLGGIDANGDLP